MQPFFPALLMITGVGTALALRVLSATPILLRSRQFLQLSTCCYGFFLVLFLREQIPALSAQTATSWELLRCPIFESIAILLAWTALATIFKRLAAPDWLATLGLVLAVISFDWVLASLH
jgi:hypothetical protein